MAEEKNSISTVVKSLMDGAESVLTSKTVVGAPVRIGDQISKIRLLSPSWLI